MSTDQPYVSIDRVSVRYGPKPVLHDLTLEIAAGSVYALLGSSFWATRSPPIS